MKKLLVLGFSVVALLAASGSASAADLPTKQEGRVWIDTNLLLAFTPNWSLTTMPGARVEFARTREGRAGMQFLELFFGPNYTLKLGNLTVKASLWYYYMGYPQRGRLNDKGDCTLGPFGTSTTCASNYNASHNIEIIPAAEYRFGRWSVSDRVIFHNTFYADTYSAATPTLPVSDQRWGWGTVLRELLQVRYAVTDRLGVSLADEVFLGIIEDGDTSKMRKADGSYAGYTPTGYWKRGLRYNRTYLGFDYKVTPNMIVAPMYMVELGLNPVDSGDLTDVAHTLFMVVTFATSTFGNK
jgi:hypothetical protein